MLFKKNKNFFDVCFKKKTSLLTLLYMRFKKKILAFTRLMCFLKKNKRVFLLLMCFFKKKTSSLLFSDAFLKKLVFTFQMETNGTCVFTLSVVLLLYFLRTIKLHIEIRLHYLARRRSNNDQILLNGMIEIERFTE